LSVLPLNGQYAALIYQNGIKSNRTTTSNLNFTDALSEASSNSILSALEAKFGTKISVQDISKDGIDSLSQCSIGVGNVTIAPNILEKMATDPKTRLYYEQKIQAHFDTNPAAHAFMAARGRHIVARGVT